MLSESWLLDTRQSYLAHHLGFIRKTPQGQPQPWMRRAGPRGSSAEPDRQATRSCAPAAPGPGRAPWLSLLATFTLPAGDGYSRH